MTSEEDFDELIGPISRRVRLACTVGAGIGLAMWLAGRWPLWVAVLPVIVLLAWPWLVQRYGRRVLGRRDH